MRRAEIGVGFVAALVCAASVLARVVILSTSVPTPFLVFGQSDVYETWRDAHLEGHVIPYFGTGFAYPPVIGYVAGVLSAVVSSPRSYLLGWGLVIVAAAAVTGALLAHAASTRRALAFWACAPQLLLFAGINFDVLAAAFATGTAILARRGQTERSLFLAAIGTATKFFPAAFAPLVVLRTARANRGRALSAAAGFAFVLAIVYLPAAAAPYSQLAYSAQYAYGIGANFDSVWALPALMLQAAGIDPKTPILVISAIGLVATYLLLVVPRALRAADPVVGFALATATILLWNRFYSPQYDIWLLPFFALLPLRARTFVLLSVADVMVFITVFTLTLVLRPPDALRELFFAGVAAAVALRHVALIVFWRDMSRLAPSSSGAATPGRAQDLGAAP